MSPFAPVIGLLLLMEATMSDVQQPNLLDEALGSNLVKQVSGSSHNVGKKALSAQVIEIFGSKYTISGSHYFAVSADVPWIAISKNVQNQMLERSIHQSHYDKADPGIVLVDFYPQPHGAFVLAMDKGSSRESEKLVGYFVLQPKSST